MRDVLEVLNGSGHLTLAWNPSDPAEVAHARAEVERLKAAGYSFFAVVAPTEGDEVERGQGRLIVERIAEPSGLAEASTTPPVPKRGRPPGKPNRTIAVQPLRGG